MSKKVMRVALSTTIVITAARLSGAAFAAPPIQEDPKGKMSAEAPPPAPDAMPGKEIPAPTMDTNNDGKADAWDRDANGMPDAWDDDGDGKPDRFDNDGDGKPDSKRMPPPPEEPDTPEG